jgi:3'-phosphoadenosine 5'-phosphosulfate sulfotransferase (PAPS reductase)/FAD synthetase
LDTTINEPMLTEEDHHVWNMWQQTSLLHAHLRRFRRKLASAKQITEMAIEKTAGNLAIMLSGGKDSVTMTHLARVGMGLDLPCISEKDDMDYPGEREYLLKLAEAWKLNLEIVSPSISMKALITELFSKEKINHISDVHGRTSAFSKEYFYRLIEEVGSKYRGIMLGLRAEESRARKENRRYHGTVYVKKSGQIVCTPLADWSGKDVMAYMAVNEIAPLPVYKCCAFMHRDEPWQIRKSWWVPGVHGTDGGVAWLRRYYPSLYAELVKMCPAASMLA